MVQHGNSAPDAATFRVGGPTWALHPAVAERPADHHVDKRLPGSFTGTDLDAWARAHAIDTFAVTGYMTQMCCDTTARQAFQRGYRVEFLGDATGTLDLDNAGGRIAAADLHRAILATQASVFSRVLTTAAWCAQVGEPPGA